jgi:1,4-dihydroxy-2-naphthoate octaprenyltransferase
MVKTRLTRLGKIFLVLMLLFYGAAVTSQSGLLLLLIGLIGGCFAVNWTFSRRNAKISC